MTSELVLGGTERNASTLELFFDLVYVFAITQVVSFNHNEPTSLGLAKGAFLLLLLWWRGDLIVASLEPAAFIVTGEKFV